VLAITNQNSASQMAERTAALDPVSCVKHGLIARFLQFFRLKDDFPQFPLPAKRKNRGAFGPVQRPKALVAGKQGVFCLKILHCEISPAPTQ